MKTIKKTILSFTLVFFMMILPVGDSAKIIPVQYQEPDNKQEYLHLKPSHRNPEHVRRAVRQTLRCHRSA